MCGRFSLSDILQLKPRFQIDLPPELSPRYNIAPSQDILTIIKEDNYLAAQFRWGLIPFWSKDKSSGIINARAETVDKKPSFKNSFKKRRCLIPADGYYEWKKEGSRKRPYRFLLKAEEVFTFAGLWDAWTSPEGETVYSCTIITTAANELVASIHNRMPVILSKEAEKLWLNDETDQKTLKDMLKPYPAELMDSYEISTMVNSPRNDVPEIFKPA